MLIPKLVVTWAIRKRALPRAVRAWLVLGWANATPRRDPAAPLAAFFKSLGAAPSEESDEGARLRQVLLLAAATCAVSDSSEEFLRNGPPGYDEVLSSLLAEAQLSVLDRTWALVLLLGKRQGGLAFSEPTKINGRDLKEIDLVIGGVLEPFLETGLPTDAWAKVADRTFAVLSHALHLGRWDGQGDPVLREYFGFFEEEANALKRRFQAYSDYFLVFH